MNEQAKIKDFYIQYIELFKFFKTIANILTKQGDCQLLSLINELTVFKMATVLRELIMRHYKNRKERETKKVEFFGEEYSMQYFYEICCKVIHINIYGDEMPSDFLLKMDCIGGELFKLCNKTDPEIAECIEKPHASNEELLYLYQNIK